MEMNALSLPNTAAVTGHISALPGAPQVLPSPRDPAAGRVRRAATAVFARVAGARRGGAPGMWAGNTVAPTHSSLARP